MPCSLITSDGYLLKEEDVENFFNHYQEYWSKITLFQVPHHGAAYSSNHTLYAQLPPWVLLPLNCGTKRKKHPHLDVLSAITANGFSGQLYPVNEFRGLIFIQHLIAMPEICSVAGDCKRYAKHWFEKQPEMKEELFTD